MEVVILQTIHSEFGKRNRESLIRNLSDTSNYRLYDLATHLCLAIFVTIW